MHGTDSTVTADSRAAGRGGAASRGLVALDLAAILVCAALAAVYVTPHFLDGDEAIFGAVAQRMQAFGLPAAEAGWEHKPPGIFQVYALLLRPWDDGGMTLLHAAAAASWVATAALCGLAARRIAGAAAFAPTVLVYGLLRSMGDTKAGAANTEAFLSPLLAAGCAVLLLGTARRARAAFAGGLLLGLAFLMKPNAAVFGPAAVVGVLLLDGRRAALTAAAASLAGSLLVVGTATAILVANGTLADAMWLTWDANRIYMEHAPKLGAAGHLAKWRDAVAGAAAPWLLAAIALGAALLRPATDAPRARRAAAAMLLLFGAAAVAVSVGGLYFGHYWWMLHPVLAVAAGLGVAALVRICGERFGDRRGAALALAAVALVCGVLWGPAHWTDKRRLASSFLLRDTVVPPYESQEVLDVAAAVRASVPEGGTVYVWGSNPEIYLLSGRPAASRQIVGHFLTGALRPDVRSGKAPPDPGVAPRAWALLAEDLRARPPALVVDSSPSGYRGYDLFPPSKFPEFDAWLRTNYVPAGNVGKYALWAPARK